jgi:hypothetical protein
MSQKRGREGKEDSESELDAAVRQAADEELLQACRSGTIVEVKAALRKGANWIAIDNEGCSGLMLACWRELDDAAVPIVKLLLRKMCPVSQCESHG